MSTSLHDSVYSKSVVSFVTIANDYCLLLENVNAFTRAEFVDKANKLLPILYAKALLLPEVENIFDDGNEKFVTEDDWLNLKDSILSKMGPFDTFPEVFDENIAESDNFVTSSISEQLTDIYQDLKDFVLLYRVSTEEIMNDAIWECKQNFSQYWGQKLVNVLRALHNINFSDINLTETDGDSDRKIEENNEIDTSSWLINKRFEDFWDEREE